MARVTKTDRASPVYQTTRRAYTMRLRGDDGDESWRDDLWKTHSAFNTGVRLFGEFLLTLRGGLPHELADEAADDEGRRTRRILLALSWLSVEDQRAAPTGALRIAEATDPDRGERVASALRSILAARGVKGSRAEEWIEDCRPSLSARIRDDAAWIDRSRAFDELRRGHGGLDRGFARDQIMDFFGPEERYFALPGPDSDELADEAPDFRLKSRGWISNYFGTGEKSDKQAIAGKLRQLAEAPLARLAGRPRSALVAEMARLVGGRAEATDALVELCGLAKGRPSRARLAIEKLPDPASREAIEGLQRVLREESEKKQKEASLRRRPPWIDRLRDGIERGCGVPYVVGRNLTGEFGAMLDQGARRVGTGHSWIRRAEAERRRLETGAMRLEQVPEAAARWLRDYIESRTESSGSLAEDGYRIRGRAIEGWRQVVQRWSAKDVRNLEQRVDEVRLVQSEWNEDEKFGDQQLFEALAADDAEPVWRLDGEPNPSILGDFVKAAEAEHDRRRFKVPAYRHPDPLRSPVFVEFGKSRWRIAYGAHQRGSHKKSPTSSRSVDLDVWDGHELRRRSLRWSSKRLARDLGLDAAPAGGCIDASRVDRLGRVAAGAGEGDAVRPSGLFEQKEWNGRLQAPRDALAAIAARVDARGWDESSRARLSRLKWSLTLSAELECRGPFVEYAAERGIRPARKGGWFPHSEANKGRSGMAKLQLCRLAGLRILSVDLGHRHAAACAVWQALSAGELAADLRGSRVVSGSKDGDSMFLHAVRRGRDGRERRTIYRRIADDRLDRKEHPASWARLDRQFLIKLPGEDSEPRRCSPQEHREVEELERELGLTRSAGEPLPRRVDLLMSHALRRMREGLRRLGDAARIAHAFKPDSRRHLSGGRVVDHDRDSRRREVADALARWHERASEGADAAAVASWTSLSMRLAGLPAPATEEVPRRERKKRRAALVEALLPLADAAIAMGTAPLYEDWCRRHRELEPIVRARLRWLRRWLLPRGTRPAKDDSPEVRREKSRRRGASRHVGGLGLVRIANLTALHRLQRSFAMRPAPEDPRLNVPAEGDSRTAGLGAAAMRALDRLRTQRARQVASRIVEAALGAGRVRRRGERDPRRPEVSVDPACHAVVVEDLRFYRPDDLRTRAENRALMAWSSGKIRDFVIEGCELHGLLFRETSPNYTSRQCSRTGRPGVRCEEIPLRDLVESPWWRARVESAEESLRSGGEAKRDRLLAALAVASREAVGDPTGRTRNIVVPRRGGELFVAAPGGSDAGVIQADLNAAANVGLRALTDPDFAGRWWWIPCEMQASGAAEPVEEKFKGSACFDRATLDRLRLGRAEADGVRPSKRGRGRKADANGRKFVNYWRDPSPRPLSELDRGGSWKSTTEYWTGVESRVARALAALCGVPLLD